MSFIRPSRAALGLGLAALALSALTAASAAAPAAAAATPPARTLAGTLTWEYTVKAKNSNESLDQKITGTFAIDAVEPKLGDGFQVGDSTYKVDETYTDAVNLTTNCPETTTRSAKLSGPLTDGSGPGFLGFNGGPPAASWMDISISVQANVKQKSENCNGTITEAVPLSYDAECRGQFHGADAGGTIVFKCKQHSAGITEKFTGTLAIDKPCAAPFELSGASWAEQFKGSSQIEALAPGFKEDVQRFVDAMEAAGITVVRLATYRPYERSYMMHFSFMIANNLITPKAVPPFDPPPGSKDVNICWVHYAADGTYDNQASVNAAKAMVKALDVDTKLAKPPPLKSQHNVRLAIDMKTTWSKNTITIADGSGHNVTINTAPHDGLNAQLMAVGATYDVFHFCYPAGTCSKSTPEGDAHHWSNDGD